MEGDKNNDFGWFVNIILAALLAIVAIFSIIGFISYFFEEKCDYSSMSLDVNGTDSHTKSLESIRGSTIIFPSSRLF
jgi:hypothetical protein